MINFLVKLFIVLPVKLFVAVIKLLAAPLRLLGPLIRLLVAPLRWLGKLVSHPKLFLGAALVGAAAVAGAAGEEA